MQYIKFTFLSIITSSSRDLSDPFVSQNPRNFMRLILSERFWFGSLVKFQFLVQFPIDHFTSPSRTNPVVPNLILPFVLVCYIRLRWDESFRFFFFSTKPTLVILFRMIHFCFNIISPYGVVLSSFFDRFSFYLSIFLS